MPNVDYIVDITEQFKFKTKAINAYNSQHKIISGISSFIEGISLVRGYEIGINMLKHLKIFLTTKRSFVGENCLLTSNQPRHLYFVKTISKKWKPSLIILKIKKSYFYKLEKNFLE